MTFVMTSRVTIEVDGIDMVGVDVSEFDEVEAVLEAQPKKYGAQLNRIEGAHFETELSGPVRWFDR